MCVLARSSVWCELNILPAPQIRKKNCSCPLTVGPKASEMDFDFKSQTVGNQVTEPHGAQKSSTASQAAVTGTDLFKKSAWFQVTARKRDTQSGGSSEEE